MAIGHEVRLTPPACVKPYAKRGKTDAEAIAEAVSLDLGRPDKPTDKAFAESFKGEVRAKRPIALMKSTGPCGPSGA